ncbi:CapA family protein [Bounagaea algeriensis]
MFASRRTAPVLALVVVMSAASCTAGGRGGLLSLPPVDAPQQSSPTPAPSPGSTREPREFTLVGTGDVLLHEPLWQQAERDAGAGGEMDFAPQLAGIAPVVEAADVAVCHLEVPLAAEGGPHEGYPRFSGPPQVATALADTGYDACTTASNHTFDQGAEGVDRTLDTLDAAGIAHAGSARTEQEAGRTTTLDVPAGSGSVRVALLSYTFGFNGASSPDGEAWRSNEIDEAKILDDAAAARADGAEVVVAATHWGEEYEHEPDEQQRALAPELIASPDIDLLLGHHAHVVQPIENFDGEWVVYGMGNLMANHAEPEGPKSEGLLTSFTFTEDGSTGEFGVTDAEYLPLHQTDEPPLEVLDVPAALEGGDVGTAGAARLEETMERTTEVVESRGGAEAGLSVLGSG